MAPGDRPAGAAGGGACHPHAWAVDALVDVVGLGGRITDITTELAILGAFAVVLLALATWRLRRTLTR